MQPLDFGDIQLDNQQSSRQKALYEAIRAKIVNRLWQKSGRLPATRKLAEYLKLSRNTVIAAYEQLQVEGYIDSQPGAGYFVAVTMPEHYLNAISQAPKNQPESAIKNTMPLNSAFAPGVPDLHQFPYQQWQKLLQRHGARTTLSGSNDLQGLLELRQAISQYLSSSRAVHCDPSRIIITSGAQQALYIGILATLSPGQALLMEDPGYVQMKKVLELAQVKYQTVNVEPKTGLNIDEVLQHSGDALYITPSNQYPLGTSLNTEQRLALIDWAQQHNSWIFEDDYDSEFQFAHRPYTALQGLASQSGAAERCIYIGTFSKTLFNAMRIGYMVVPAHLLNQCLTIKDAISGDTPTHIQAALADFINEGSFLRHIRKMRRLYQQKYQAMLDAIQGEFGNQWQVISQAAGLHITVQWQQGPNEMEFVAAAKQQQITVRPLSYYQAHPNADKRNWQAVILGFGNVAIADIPVLVAQLKLCFNACSDIT